MTGALGWLRTNIILYCGHWAEIVSFNRDTPDLAVTHATDWFVEVNLVGSAHLSLADAARATIAPGRGTGVTLSRQVTDLDGHHGGRSRSPV